MKISKDRITIWIIEIMLLVAFFVPNRFKISSKYIINGHGISNSIFVYMFMIILLLIINYKKSGHISKVFVVQMLLFIISLFMGIVNKSDQLLYSLLIFNVPLLIMYTTKNISNNKRIDLFKYFVNLTGFYSLLIILVCLKIPLVSLLVQDSEGLNWRASLMLGGPITLSNLLNIGLVCTLFIFEKTKNNIYIVFLILNIFATILLQSRASIVVMILILLWYLYKYKNILSPKLLSLMCIIFYFLIRIFEKYELNRIFLMFRGTSAEVRKDAAKLAQIIFKDYPIFGTGMGTYFKRLYIDRNIQYKGNLGLVDPHNLYILLLSEVGIVGILLVIFLIVLLLKSFFKKSKLEKNFSLVLLVAILLDNFFGSHLANEPDYSIIVWLLISLFYWWEGTINE